MINFVESNVADAPEGGATFSPPGPTVVRVLDEAEGSGLAALAGVWRTYEGDVGRALANLRAKLRANWIDWEIPDNTSFDFFRAHAATLRFAPTFGVVFPLGVAGMLAAAWSVLQRRKSATPPTKKELKRAQSKSGSIAPVADDMPRPLAGHLVLLLLFLGLVASLSLVHTVARFRMYLVPVLVVYGGILLGALWDALRERRFGRALLLVLLALPPAAYQISVSADAASTFERGVRPVDFMVASKLAIERGDFDAALRFNDEARAEYPRESMIPTAAAQESERAGQRELAIQFYRRAVEIDPNAQFARSALQRLKAN